MIFSLGALQKVIPPFDSNHTCQFHSKFKWVFRSSEAKYHVTEKKKMVNNYNKKKIPLKNNHHFFPNGYYLLCQRLYHYVQQLICLVTKHIGGSITRLVWFGLVSSFNGISTYVDYLMLKLCFKKNGCGAI